MSDASYDAARCPLCNEPNQCGAARGAGSCWCWTAQVAAEALSALPEDARGVVCLCPACAAGKPSPARVQVTLRELIRRR